VGNAGRIGVRRKAAAENKFGAFGLFVTKPFWWKKNAMCLSITILTQINLQS